MKGGWLGTKSVVCKEKDYEPRGMEGGNKSVMCEEREGAPRVPCVKGRRVHQECRV